MPPIDMTNPDTIKFFIENYEKTARLRMKWNNLYWDKLNQAATLTREEKGYWIEDVLKKTMAEGLPTITRDNTSGARNKRKKPIRDAVFIPGINDMKKGHSIVDVGLADPKKDPTVERPDTDLKPDPVMRPINPKHKKLIYKGLPNFGREVYLKERTRIAPEDKYYFRECSGWEYGWRLQDSYFSRHVPQYGRVWLLTRDAASRSGPQPDPDHYQTIKLPGPDKCNM
ncbi:unnamed protein product [Spodoptera exigua]|uniref:Sperm microtubule inner protein 1 C-terminal domain-containing protein n=1 Tax=Spodoptera exigua TaxID=7107 RepID=A0A922MRC4_SPOEX|nr:hypothetical protein HF086_011441 [Spodoptera exigua]CAH0687801.1 unnamed protein product [Spodoptera exigua]